MARSNRTNHWEVRFEDGETFAEKCRDSIGGFANMMDRIAERIGVCRFTGIRAETPAAEVWRTSNGRRFQIVPVEVIR